MPVIPPPSDPAIEFLLALPRFADAGAAALKPGLERMEALLDAMGHPHERYPSVHVGGTNGKGSTASMLAAIATATGRRTGLHTSPHLHDLAERMRLDGEPAPHAWLARAVARHREAFERVGPSFFEATAALSLLYFAERGVDLAVVEVGLGGRLDATNVLRPKLALVTRVGLDHTELLGETREAIAREKAGIAKPGGVLLTTAEGEGVLAAMRAEAEARGARLVRVQDEAEIRRLAPHPEGLVLDLATPVRAYDGLVVGLAGRHQAWNAALAVRAAERVLPGIEAGAVARGLAEVRKLSGLAGRCEVLERGPTIVADVAHNEEGLEAALALAREQGPGRLFVLLGVMGDKDLPALAGVLAAEGAAVLPVPLPSPRALPQPELRRRLRRRGLALIDVDDVADGLRWFRRHASPQDVLLATGSHLTVAAVREALGPPYL